MSRVFRSPWFGLVIAFFAIADAIAITLAASYRPATWQREPRLALVDTLPVSPDASVGHVDGLFTDRQQISISAAGQVDVPGLVAFTIRGWAYDRSRQLPFAAMLLTLDGEPLRAVPYGTARPDVAAVMHCPRCASSGYVIAFDARQLRRGRHRIRTEFITPDAAGEVAGPALQINVR